MEAFIVRPFGIKNDVDFDKVERELILPALLKAGIFGSTTAAILEAGNIREDMFQKLLTADLVVADLSIHNANVFYELGIRHALRDKKTYLIRCSKDEIPFDLKTDRYLSYDAANPAATVELLTTGLKDTVNSDRQDSPVFLMLPKLDASDPEKFLAIPNDFGEEVEMARAAGLVGKLALLAEETDGFPWQIPALRLIGEVQFGLKAIEDARLSWEKIRTRNFSDIEANDRLATIYQRLAESATNSNPASRLELFAKSDMAIERLLSNFSKLERSKRAEIIALKARNAKSKWIDSWKDAPEALRAKNALQSRYLKDSCEDYERAYYEDLNHFYSGINALSMLTILINLAERLPDIFALNYESEDDAAITLRKLKQQQQKQMTVVSIAIDSEKKRLQLQGLSDFWLMFTEADLSCIIQTVPERVANLYRKAVEGAGNLNVEAAQRQLLIYEQLNVLPQNVKAALAEFTSTKNKTKTDQKHHILFTGHMLDQPDRKEPRFPANMESTAREAIKQAVKQEQSKIDGEIVGIAGGACGGDILFHEVCEELNIPTELYLALPRDQFLKASVQFAGPEWIDRFDRFYKKLPVFVLAESEELPKWLQKKANYSIWERNNLWMLKSALVCGGLYTSLVVLWDGKAGDASGGTEHMVQQAQDKGAKTIIIDTKKLFGL